MTQAHVSTDPRRYLRPKSYPSFPFNTPLPLPNLFGLRLHYGHIPLRLTTGKSHPPSLSFRALALPNFDLPLGSLLVCESKFLLHTRAFDVACSVLSRQPLVILVSQITQRLPSPLYLMSLYHLPAPLRTIQLHYVSPRPLCNLPVLHHWLHRPAHLRHPATCN